MRTASATDELPATATRESGPVAPAQFRDLFRSHPGAVTIVTAAHAEGAVGFTATSVISLSADPPLLAFSISESSSSSGALRRATHATVHFLDVDDVAIAERFATSGVDRFAGLPVEEMPDGTPRLTPVTTWAWGPLVQRLDVDGATLAIMRIDRSSAAASRRPLAYHDRAYRRVEPAER